MLEFTVVKNEPDLFVTHIFYNMSGTILSSLNILTHLINTQICKVDFILS